MRPQELIIRLELPHKEGEAAATLEAANAIVARDLAGHGRGMPLMGYLCPSLRCGTFVIRPEE